MDIELKENLLELIEEYKRLATFIEDEAPISIASYIRGELYLEGYLDGLAQEIKNQSESKEE